MLIGTVSTVNAATSTKKVFLLNAANWETPCAYCWDGSNENGKWPGIAMTKEGTKDGFDVYSFTPSTGYSNIIFNDNGNGSTQSAKFDYPITDNQMYIIQMHGQPIQAVQAVQVVQAVVRQKLHIIFGHQNLIM